MTKYLVKWKGYDVPEDNTWEPAENLANTSALEVYLDESQLDLRPSSSRTTTAVKKREMLVMTMRSAMRCSREEEGGGGVSGNRMTLMRTGFVHAPPRTALTKPKLPPLRPKCL